MTQHAIETATFKLLPTVSDSDFLKAAEAANIFLKSCDGFVRRHLSKGDDGVWLDHVEWRSLSTAKAASEAFFNHAPLKPFMQAIDMGSAIMSHYTLLMAAE